MVFLPLVIPTLKSGMENTMTKAEATAEIFVTALKLLPKDERDVVLARLAEEKTLSRDLIDLAILSQRKDEPSRPFEEYLSENQNSGT